MNISPEQWRGQASEKLDQIEGKLDHMHLCFEARIQPLERFKNYMVGAAYMLGLLSPLLWWFVSTKILPVIERGPGR